ncbi:YcdB/YcdC domain-containing protein [uncultured Peptoniphilus sp.]|uniref:YcdB/YcdC domain-containing protein n=1 Tax=uncultured Peptoniphilus sp. TaxID=254354 RepID=UPI00280619CA|nr:YcdB/YcdC domain-containing protein [uncultured Peptoniphilus sp.]
MKSKTKFIISMLLIFTMLVGTSCSTMAKGGTTSKNVNKNPKTEEEYILKAKDTFEISDDYTELDIESSKDSKRSEKYRFHWFKEDGDDGINVSMDKEGNIISYNHYANRDNKIKDHVSREAIEKAALKYLEKIDKNLVGSHKVVSVDYDNYENTAAVTFRRYVGDVPVIGTNLVIQIDLSDMSLAYYDSGLYYLVKDKTVSKDAKLIGLDSAKEKIEKINPIILAYMSNRYGEDNTAKLNYMPKNEKYIDAVSGKAVDFNDGGIYYAEGDMKAEEAKDSAGLTEVEKKSVKEFQGLMKKEDLRKLVQDLIPKDSKIDRERITKGDRYEYSFEARRKDRSAYFSLDAKDGTLTNFNDIRDTKEKTAPKAEEAIKIATEFKDKYAKKLVDFNYKDPNIYSDTYCTRIIYSQLKDEVPVVNYGVTVELNNDNKKVSTFSLREYTEKFENKEGIKSLEEAKKIYFDENSFKLLYMVKDNKLKPVYGYEDLTPIGARTLNKYSDLGEFINLEKSKYKTDLEKIMDYKIGFMEDKDVLESATVKDLADIVEDGVKLLDQFSYRSNNPFKDLKMDKKLDRLDAIKIIFKLRGVNLEGLDSKVFKEIDGLKGEDLVNFQMARSYGLTSENSAHININVDELLSIYYRSMNIR